MQFASDLSAARFVDNLREEHDRDERMAADLTMLREVGSLCAREGKNLDKCLHEILDAGIAITGADKGNIQLLEPEMVVLTIAAQRGFGPAFLKYFEYVYDGASACAAAMRSGERLVVEDVTTSEIFAGKPSMNVLVYAGVRAVISTLLISSAGNLLGMISTHFRKPHHPSERQLGFMDLLARQAADYLERKRAEEIEEARVREIRHRINNQLAVIQTVAYQTFSSDRSVVEAKKIFDERLQALARANRWLNELTCSPANLSEIVRSALAPFGDRTMIDGVGVLVSAQHAQSFSLALYELATNAAKYGALSSESGRVNIFWTIERDGIDSRLKFKWRETGGPPVVAPTGHGFGTSLLRATFADVRIDYLVKGLTCEIDLVLGRAEPVKPARDSGVTCESGTWCRSVPGRADLQVNAEAERAHRRTEATTANQLTWVLFGYNPSKGETTMLLKDMSTTFARNFLRALDCPQSTVKRLNDDQHVMFRRESAEWHLVRESRDGAARRRV